MSEQTEPGNNRKKGVQIPDALRRPVEPDEPELKRLGENSEELLAAYRETELQCRFLDEYRTIIEKRRKSLIKLTFQSLKEQQRLKDELDKTTGVAKALRKGAADFVTTLTQQAHVSLN
jgi:hypothetical protein